MQFLIKTAAALVFALAVQAIATPPTPELSCQACEPFGASDACCSASCIAQGKGFHGGFCDDHEVCNCTV
ncbi:atesin-3 [Mycena pura]|uniref:Atesin-3 n=1 Tax=Mycena pura TaxID=153505 RepID=A0AAD6VG11_9AGAR|nr:atesin-3 [Mycena pura]